MIQIYINGLKAAVDKDFTMEYVVENRLFTNADGYSLDIELPLKDCEENIRIFGILFHRDSDLSAIRYPAQIVSNHVTLSGVVVIVGVSETSVKVQFLEGRSAQNNDIKLDEVYINDLEIGPAFKAEDNNCYNEWDNIDNAKFVPLPWVNNNSDSGNLQNNIKVNGTFPYNYEWDLKVEGLSVQWYLIPVIKAICDNVGYRCDLSELENSRFRYLLICNSLPYALGVKEYAHALPHWTVNEFFENIEIILQGEFDIDNIAKTVKFSFTSDVLRAIEPEMLWQVVDEFDADVDASDDADSKSLIKNVAFADNGSRFWKFKSCQWAIDNWKKRLPGGDGWVYPTGDVASMWYYDDQGHRHYKGEYRYDNLVELDSIQRFIEDFREYEDFMGWRNQIIQSNLYHAKDTDIYFVFRKWGYSQRTTSSGTFFRVRYEPFPVNEFGPYLFNDKDEDFEELKTVPVPIDTAEGIKVMFLSLSEQTSGDDLNSGNSEGETSEEKAIESLKVQPYMIQTIEAGDGTNHEYYDKLYLGFWRGYEDERCRYTGPHPLTSNVEICRWNAWNVGDDVSLRLNRGFIRGLEEYKSIQKDKLYKFSFISKTIPSVRATFFIGGHRYLCSRLQVSFDIDGMQTLIKGEFYRY